MKELKEYLSGIVIGVRYRNNYSIEDHLGSIADELLYSNKKGLLNCITFPVRTTKPSIQTSLYNQITGDSLLINMNNIILDINFSDIIPKDKSADLIEEFFKALTEKIYSIIKIHDIRMVGLVYKYIINDETSTKAVKNTFKDITFEDASSVTVNFSKKKILSKSKIKKGLNDYENIICTLSTLHENKNEYYF
jgi:hypothetical protein